MLFRLFAFITALIISWGSIAYAVTLNLGLNVFQFDYQEDVPAPQKSRESGNLVALRAGLSAPLPRIGPEFSFDVFGELVPTLKTNYEGTDLNSNAPVSEQDPQTIFHTEGHLHWLPTPSLGAYIGLAYRIWNRGLVYGSGYREVYSWAVLPLGVEIRWTDGDRLGIGLDLSYRWMFLGQMRAIFSENVRNGEDSNFVLGNRGGVRAEIPFDWKLSPLLKLRVAPWYEVSEIGQSAEVYNGTPGIQATIREPSSRTVQTGVFTLLQMDL